MCDTSYIPDTPPSVVARDREVRESIHKVLEGFDKGVFVRNTDNDAQPNWALKAFPYLRALAVLAKETNYTPS